MVPWPELNALWLCCAHRLTLSCPISHYPDKLQHKQVAESSPCSEAGLIVSGLIQETPTAMSMSPPPAPAAKSMLFYGILVAVSTAGPLGDEHFRAVHSRSDGRILDLFRHCSTDTDGLSGRDRGQPIVLWSVVRPVRTAAGDADGADAICLCQHLVCTCELD